jgi:hypothetical protein
LFCLQVYNFSYFSNKTTYKLLNLSTM